MKMTPTVREHSMEYHAWFIRRPNGPGPTVEVVDLTTRHYPAYARRLDIPWYRTDIPPFVWDRYVTFHDLGIRLVPEQEMTDRLFFIVDEWPLIAEMARKALATL